MRRRALLASLAATALPLSAGCSGDGDDGSTPGGMPTETPTGGQSGTADDEHTLVEVEDVSVQQGYVVREVADAIGVVGDDRRYVWASVSIGGQRSTAAAFKLDTGDARVSPLPDPRAYWLQTNEDAHYFDTEEGYLLFEVPSDVGTAESGDIPSMAITTLEQPHELDAATAARIAGPPPSFAVSIEKRYAETTTEPIAVTVTNESDVDGRFVGALNRQGPRVEITPVQRVAVDVPAGETRTVPIADDWSDRTPTGARPDDRPVVEYALDWAGGSTSVGFDEV